MRHLILVAFFCLIYGCSRQNVFFKEDGKEVVKIIQIDSTDNAYFMHCQSKEIHDFILVSWKREVDKCLKKVEIGGKYIIDIDIETFEGGDYDGYMVDGKEFTKETIVAYTDDLQGLCLLSN